MNTPSQKNRTKENSQELGALTAPVGEQGREVVEQPMPFKQRAQDFVEKQLQSLTYAGDWAEILEQVSALVGNEEFSGLHQWSKMYILCCGGVAASRINKSDIVGVYFERAEAIQKEAEACGSVTYYGQHFLRLKGLASGELAFKPAPTQSFQRYNLQGSSKDPHLESLIGDLTGKLVSGNYDSAVLLKDGCIVPLSGDETGVFYGKGCPQIVQLTSLTKAVAAVVAFKMVHDRHLYLTEPVRHILRDCSWKDLPEEVTVGHLLTHTSGLQRDRESGASSETPKSLKDACPSADQMSNKVGEYGYSNLAVDLLALIFEKKLENYEPPTGQASESTTTELSSYPKLDSYITEKVFKPLGIETTRMCQHQEDFLLSCGMRTILTDIARVAEMVRCEGTFAGEIILAPETIHTMLGRDGGPSYLWSLETYPAGNEKSYEIIKFLGSLDNNMYIVPEFGLVAVASKEFGPDRQLKEGEKKLEDCPVLGAIKRYLVQAGSN